MYSLSRDIFMLFGGASEGLWNYILRYVSYRAVPDLPGGSPMAVGLDRKKINYELYYVPEIMGTLLPVHRKVIIEHELMHISFGHLVNRRPGEHITSVDNLAMDAAINSFFEPSTMPPFGIYPGRPPLEDLPRGKAFEWYHRVLKDNQAAKTIRPLDAHLWDDIPDEIIHRLEQKTNQLLAGAYEAAEEKGWGSAPEAVKRHIEYNVLGLLNWRSVLGHFVRRSNRVGRKSSIRRFNKRFPGVLPGRRATRQPRVHVASDQSGSISDDLLGLFCGELTRLAQLATFFFVPFDTEVDEEGVVEWNHRRGFKVKRTKSGGTNFQSVVNWAEDRGSEGLVFLTDMWAPVPAPSRVPRVWITNIENKERAQIFIEAGEKVGFIDSE